VRISGSSPEYVEGLFLEVRPNGVLRSSAAPWSHTYEKARHARWREEAEKVRAEAVRRRVFRLLILPTVNLIEKVEECAEEIERAWRDFSAVSWKTFVYWNSAA
jgi:hypothetical protein